MESRYHSYEQYSANNSNYFNSNYYNYPYYDYYQDQVPENFNFNTLTEYSPASPNNLNNYSNNLSINNDKTEYSNLYNYNLGYSSNDSQNFSYNDSAYQSQLETSNFYNSYSNKLENLNTTHFHNQTQKRIRIEDTFLYSHESQESNKRPKIYKIEDDNKNDYFYCEECSLSFISKAKFLLHQFKAHKNGNSCVCPVCYKKFGNQANTLVHLRGHTQEKTYKCNQCSHAFYDSSTLKKHLRTHTGEKPYKCHICTKKFTQSGNLKRHLLVHKKYDEDIQEKIDCNSNNLLGGYQFEWSKYCEKNIVNREELKLDEYNPYNDFFSSNY